MLAKNAQTPLTSRQPTSSFTTIASMLAPTGKTNKTASRQAEHNR